MDPIKSSNSIITKCKAEYTSMVISLFKSEYSNHFRNKNLPKENQINYPLLLSQNFNLIGDKFIIKEENKIIFVEIKDLIITDYFSRINFNIYKTIPKSLNYELIFDIYYNSIDDTCTLFSSYIYEKNNDMILDDIKKKKINENKNMIFNIEKSINNNELSKLIIISELIFCNIDLLWAFFLNMKIVHKYTKLIANKVEYEGDVIGEDMVIKLGRGGRKFNEATVTKCGLRLKEGEIEIVINPGFNLRFNENRILIKMYEYDNKCTIQLFFFFNKKYNDLQKHFYEMKKHHELKLIKKMVEHYNNNLGAKIDDINSDSSSTNNEFILYESFNK